MSLFDYFRRNDKYVQLDIDSNLGTCKPVYPLFFDCDNQENAELLKRHLNKELSKYKTEIARKALHYLDKSEISDLKKELKQWDSRKLRWK